MAGGFVLIANEKRREAFLKHNRIQSILAPAIQAICCLTPAETIFFPTPPFTGKRTGPRMTAYPMRLVPIRLAIPPQRARRDRSPNPRGGFNEPTSRVQPYLGLITSYRLPSGTLKIAPTYAGVWRPALKPSERRATRSHPTPRRIQTRTITRRSLTAPLPIKLPISAPPPTGGHRGLGLAPSYGDPVYLPGDLHRCHIRGGGRNPHESSNNGTTPSHDTKGEHPPGPERSTTACPPH
jgi:hypothetical protein